MLKIIASLFVVAIAISLSGCGAAGAENVKALLSDLQADCVRHYAGTFASGVPAATAAVNFDISCKPTNVVNSEAAVINANTAAETQKAAITQALMNHVPVPTFQQPSTVILAAPPTPTKQAPDKTVVPPPDH